MTAQYFLLLWSTLSTVKSIQQVGSRVTISCLNASCGPEMTLYDLETQSSMCKPHIYSIQHQCYNWIRVDLRQSIFIMSHRWPDSIDTAGDLDGSAAKIYRACSMQRPPSSRSSMMRLVILTSYLCRSLSSINLMTLRSQPCWKAVLLRRSPNS